MKFSEGLKGTKVVSGGVLLRGWTHPARHAVSSCDGNGWEHALSNKDMKEVQGPDNSIRKMKKAASNSPLL